jgi:hypothetical protein
MMPSRRPRSCHAATTQLPRSYQPTFHQRAKRVARHGRRRRQRRERGLDHLERAHVAERLGEERHAAGLGVRLGRKLDVAAHLCACVCVRVCVRVCARVCMCVCACVSPRTCIA